MSAFLRLPVELLTKIAKLLPQPIHLTLVCRLLNDVTTPVAYGTLTLPLFDDKHCREPGTIARALGRLLRTVMEQPSIGMHVRHLKVSFADIPFLRSRNYDEQATKITEDIRIPAIEAASSHGLSESAREELADGLLGTAFFLLLCHFPNLDSLDLIPEFRGTFFNHIATSRMLPCGLRSLRSVYIHEPDLWKEICHDDIFTLFSLPSLRKIRCEIFEPFGYEYDATLNQTVLFGGTSKIEDINIVTRHTEFWILTAMVRSVQCLRAFRYKEHDGLYAPFDGTLLGDALHIHAHNLEHLEVQVTHIQYQHCTIFGSLRQFTKLTRLAVSLPILVGSPDPQQNINRQHAHQIGELLPESLISFNVYIDEEWRHTACGFLTQFIQVDLKYVPNLKQLSLGVRSEEFCTSDLDTTELQAACVASGTTFSTADLPYQSCFASSMTST